MKIDLKAILILTATAGAVFYLLTRKGGKALPVVSEKQAQADLAKARQAAYAGAYDLA